VIGTERERAPPEERECESLASTLAAQSTARAPQLSFIWLLNSFIPAQSTSLPASLRPNALRLSFWGLCLVSPRNTFVFIHTRQATKTTKLAGSRKKNKKTKSKENQKRIKMQLMNGGMEMEMGLEMGTGMGD